MNLSASLNYLLPVQIWTTDYKLKIKEGFESVILIWAGGKQFKFSNFFMMCFKENKPSVFMAQV